MTKLKRLVAVALAILMILGSFSTAAFAADSSDENGSTLGISTKIFRLVNGDWVETKKVKVGEQVMARIYVDTDYYTNTGSLLFFYNNDFFTDSFGTLQEQLDVNPIYASGSYGITGEFVGARSASVVEDFMYNAGKIDADFAAKNDFVFINYYFGTNYRNQKLDGSQWLCQIPLTVKSEPTATQGVFQAVEATAASPTFTFGKIDVPRGSYDGYNSNIDSMVNWTATLNFENQPVTLFENPVAVTFDANGGKFADSTTSVYYEGDAGDAIEIEDPTRLNFSFEGWKVSGAEDSTASEVTVYPDQDTTYEAVWKSTTGSDEVLNFRTEIYRQDAETGEWIFTEKVKPGETVKARVFIDTSYYTQAGDLMFFYDKDFFEDSLEYNENYALNINPSEVSNHGTTGFFMKLSPTKKTITDLVAEGYISQTLVDSSIIYTARYQFNPSNSHILSGDEWFAEFELKVRDSATGEGDFFISMDTLQNPVDRTRAYVNIPLSSEGGTLIESKAMFLWEVNASIESNPVSINSTITLNANGGAFDADDPSTYVIEGVIGSKIDEDDIPAISKDGAVLLGWVDASVADPTEDDIIDIPAEMPHDDLVLNALWLNKVNVTYILNNGEADVVDLVVPGTAFVVPEEPVKDGYQFVGWSTDMTGADVTGLPDVYPDVNTEYYAIWVEKAKITFVLNNGEEDIVETVTAGEPFVAPADPAKEGNKFVGWSTDASGATVTGLPATYPAEDETYYAIFNPSTYVIKYYVTNPLSGRFELVEEGSVVYGEPVISVPPSYEVPEGYTLSKAYTDVTLSTLLAEDALMPAETLSLYYEVTPGTFDAVFDANGGAWADGETTKTVPTVYGNEIKAPADPTKEGYEFKGWDPAVSFMDDEGMTFTATWEKAEYTVTYIVDGGVYDKFTVAFEDEVDVPADPELEGYTFKGWTPEIPDSMPASDIKFIAVFEVNTHTATFDANGGAFADDTAEKEVTVNYGEAIAVPDAPQMKGYVFAGWEPSVPSSMPDENLTFKAEWDPADNTPYTVEYYTMGTDGKYGVAVTENRTGMTGATATVTTNATDGFNVADESVLSAEIAADGSTVLKVYYARNQYTITFDANGGVLDDGNETKADTYLYGTTVTAPADPTKTGYSFDCWLPTVYGVVTDDVTYVAQWEVNEYTITFGDTGDTVIDPITQDYGTAIETPENPVKEGYDFAGWDKEIPDTMPAENVTINATWTPKECKALFFESVDETEPSFFETVTFGEQINDPFIKPSKAGYTFAGWSTDGENVLDDLGIMDEESKSFYAVWTAVEVKYTVEHYYMTTELEYADTADRTDEFTAVTGTAVTAAPDTTDNFTVDAAKSTLEATVAADGTTVLKVYYEREINTLTIDVDGKVTEKEYPFDADVDKVTEPTKDGYTFNGWVDENGNETTVPEKMPGDDVTIKATWKANTHNVTYIVDGEIYHGPTATDFGSPVAEPSVPTKVGYVFAGWLDADNKKPSDYGTMPDKDLEFTAQWTANANIGYILEVYEMGTDGQYPADPTVVYNFNDGVVGDDRTVTPTVPAGFTLDTTKSELTGTIPATGTLALKAYYVRNSHKLTVVIDDDTSETPYYYGEEVASVAAPEKVGYTFAGWVDADDNEALIPAVMPDKDVTVYASWKLDSYDAVFDAGEGTFKSGSTVKIPVEFGDEITAPTEEPTRDGYKFIGWATADDPETPVTDYGTMGTDGAEYVAIWSKVSYKLTFYDFEAPASGPNLPTEQKVLASTEKEFGAEITFPDDPSFAHHIFLGWSTVKGNADYIVEEGFTMPAGNVELFAVYERVKIMLIPKNDACSTVIDRAGLTVDDYVDGESKWYVYGLEEMITEDILLDEYIDVSGDGRIVVEYDTYQHAPYTGTGTTIKVYDNVTGELVESFRIIIFGDLNGDAYINAVDTAIATDESLGATEWGNPDNADTYLEYRFLAADINMNGRVDGVDAAIIGDDALGGFEIDQCLLANN